MRREPPSTNPYAVKQFRPQFFWRHCAVCQKEFIRENGWSFKLTENFTIIKYYVCERCGIHFDKVKVIAHDFDKREYVPLSEGRTKSNIVGRNGKPPGPRPEPPSPPPPPPIPRSRGRGPAFGEGYQPAPGPPYRNPGPPTEYLYRTVIKALEESVKLQSHYATLLNQYDGGERLTFDSIDLWIDRLKKLEERMKY